MEWLQSNWLSILFVIAVFAMHMFGHGGHGHGGHRGRHGHRGRPDDDRTDAARPMPGASTHRHERDPWQEG